MKQYCRYCAHCFEGDTFFCGEHDEVLSEAKIKRANQCKDYAYSTLGDVLTGKQYQPQDAGNKRVKGISSAFLFKDKENDNG